MVNLTTEFFQSLYNHADSAHAFDHVLRVTRLAIRLAEREGADVEIVRVAALLHDVAGHRREHHFVSARIAHELLTPHFSPAFVDAVVHCIEAHRFSQPPQPKTLEAQCLHDADKLDAIGAIGVARAFAFAGARGNRLWTHPLAELDQLIGPDRAAYRQKHGGSKDYTPSHELLCKLAGLADTMFTATARQLAQERHDFMMAFFRRLDAESLGEC